VAQPKYPLRINVGFLLHSPIGSSRDIHFDFPSIQVTEDLEIKDLKGMVRLSRTPQGILLQGEFRGRKGEECVRCLSEFLQYLETSFSELYAFDERSVSDADLLVPEDGNIDLAPLIREYLMIEVPINPICRPDCKGLCPVCGENLNETTCEHVAQSN
jgi:uncharacterized protein